jgi:Lon protease-like protein
MLPPAIPIFPLPNVVLVPHGSLPLHIFEPRYREMVGDALDGDRLIGMVLLRPGWEGDYQGRPPVYPIGCAGVITHHDRMADGRYNIVLRGLEKFRITGENAMRAYGSRRSKACTSRSSRPSGKRSAPREAGSRDCSCHNRGAAAPMRNSRPQ